MNTITEVMVMSTFNLNFNHGSLNGEYMGRIIETVNRSLFEHPRTMAVRIDLRLPYIPEPNNHMDADSPIHFHSVDRSIISRFFESLKAQIKHDQYSKTREGKRVHACSVRYVWVRECSMEHKWHYHILLLLNKDAYAHLGNLNVFDAQSNLISKIRKAWSSALNGDYERCAGLVHIPENPIYYLDANDPSNNHAYGSLIYRCSYMAKDDTKLYGDGYRCFGGSQR